MSGPRVLGVDACRAGWVGVAVGDGAVRTYVGPTIGVLVAQADGDGPPHVVAVDIPISLPDRGRRSADVLARAAIGARRSSVFMTPVRPALEAADHASAVRINRTLAGEGVSVQAFALKAKLFEVEAFSRDAGRVVIEVHPEVCFAHLNGGPLVSRKGTWAGAEHRHRLLAENGVVLTGDLGEAGRQAGVDDVLDAGAAAWTARRFLAGRAVSRPDPPERFSDGWPSAIWT